MKQQKILGPLNSVTCALALLCFGLPTVQADQNLPVKFTMPIHLNATVDETGCDNSPGPFVTLDGEIALGGLQVELIFQNNAKGTHTASALYSSRVVLVAEGSAITIPKQPVLGGVGGNPWLWIQFLDSRNNPLTDEILLGRCVQGLAVSGDFLNDVAGATQISVGGCFNHPGPTITVSGDLKLSGLKGRFIFRNNAKGTHTAEQTADVTIIAEGTTVQLPKSPAQGGAGGNPLIGVQFRQGDGEPIGSPIMLGRCNKL